MKSNKGEKMELPKYTSKYDSYTIAQRLEDLKVLVEHQINETNDMDYHRGLANGLLLAWYTIAEPYGANIPFLEIDTKPEGLG